MYEHSYEVQLDPDPALCDFIDTFDLPRLDRDLLKTQSLRPPVRQELDRIWHAHEMHGEESSDAYYAIGQLLTRLKT